MNATVSGRQDVRHDAPSPQAIVAPVPVVTPVSWGAIMVGAVAAVAFGGMLNVLGIAVGASAVDAAQRQTPSAATFTVGAGIWMAVSGAVALLLGAIIAARLAPSWNRKDAMLHGLGVWGVTFVLAIALVGTALSGGTVAAIRGASGAATGIAGATVAAGAAAASQIDPDQVAEQLQRRLAAPADPATAPREQVLAEMADLTARRVADGSWRPEDRQRMEQLLAAATGLQPAEARARLEQVEREVAARAAQAEETARRAADAAATAAAIAAFWAFAAMLLGLGAAVTGAYLGARDDDDLSVHRDMQHA